MLLYNMVRRILTDKEIDLARELREKGYTKKQLADEFMVGETTIWYNIYGRRRKTDRVKRVYLYRNTKRPEFKFLQDNFSIAHIITLKRIGLTSSQVSSHLRIPLQEVNIIWSQNF